MSEEVKNEQTAVADNTNEEPKKDTSADSGAAQETDGLDELLKEFDERRAEIARQEEPKPAKTEPAGEGNEQLDVAALAALEKRLNDQEARDRRRELEMVFTAMSEGTQADEVDAEAYLNARALRDPRLNQAYVERESNPQRWKKVFGELKKDFTKRFGQKVDKQATESREAASAAIRSASTAAPPKDLTAKDIASMPQDEWRELQRKAGVTPV